MISLITKTNYEITAEFLQNFQNIFSTNTYNFILNQENYQKMKMDEHISVSSYRIMKIFSIWEESWKKIIDTIMKEEQLPQSIFKKNSQAIKFGSVSDFAASTSSLFKTQELKKCITKSFEKGDEFFAWDNYIGKAYDKRNIIVHSVGQEYYDPTKFLITFLMMFDILENYCHSIKRSKSNLRKKIRKQEFCIKIQQAIFKDFLEEQVSLFGKHIIVKKLKK